MSKLMEKVAQVAPHVADYLTNTAEEVKTSPFRDEILEEVNGLVKKAMMPPGMDLGHMAPQSGGWGGAAKAVGGALGATIAASVAYSLAGDMYDAVKRGITKNKNYKAMMESNPDLKEHPAKQVQQIFSTLHRFNPDFSADPIVAGSFVKNQISLPQVDLHTLSNIVKARTDIKSGRRLDIKEAPWEENEGREITNFKNKWQGEKAKQDFQNPRNPDHNK